MARSAGGCQTREGEIFVRYDTPIYFQRVTPGVYNVDTGDYDADMMEERLRRAAVMDTRAETLKLVYGDIRQGSLTIHIQNRYPEAFDRIRIGDKVYRVDYHRKLRTKESFVVSEVQ